MLQFKMSLKSEKGKSLSTGVATIFVGVKKGGVEVGVSDRGKKRYSECEPVWPSGKALGW